MAQQLILFVVCVNDNDLFQQAKRQLASLIVPQGYTVEVYEIRNAKSMASGYNNALHLKAAYKIYIHQDTFIIHPGMLIEMIQLFDRHPRLGMIGLAGCVNMPANGIWWEGAKLVGQVIEHRNEAYRLLRFEHGCRESEDYIQVQAIDGLFMASRVDLPWRDDLFSGFHFYDSSYSMEVQRAGYQVGVPVLQSPWCIHYNGDEFDFVSYEHFRKIFVQQYLS